MEKRIAIGRYGKNIEDADETGGLILYSEQAVRSERISLDPEHKETSQEEPAASEFQVLVDAAADVSVLHFSFSAEIPGKRATRRHRDRAPGSRQLYLVNYDKRPKTADFSDTSDAAFFFRKQKLLQRRSFFCEA